jgi:hypothetical protein
MLSAEEQLVLGKVVRNLQHYLLASQLILPCCHHPVDSDTFQLLEVILPCCLHPVDFDSFQLFEAMLGELPPEVAS